MIRQISFHFYLLMIRYDFKPASVDHSRVGSLTVDDKSVSVRIPNLDGAQTTNYRYNLGILQRSAKRLVRGCKKFVPALAYLFCLPLPGSCLARFAYLFADLCTQTKV